MQKVLRISSSILLVIFLFLLINTKVIAQINTIEAYGSKSNSMGGVSTVFKDIYSAYTNQAGLGYLQGLKTNISYENRFSINSLSSFNFAVAKNFNKIGTAAVVIKKFGFTEYHELQIGAAYAMKLNQTTSIALQINLFNLSIKGYGSKNTFSFETGIIHDFSNKLTMGFHISNPFPIKFIENQDIPTIVKIGFSYKISDYLKIYSDFEKHLNYSLFLKTGLEYSPLLDFTLYIGFKNNFDRVAEYSMGVGYSFRNRFRLIASSSYSLILGLSPSIGITYSAGKINNLK